MASGLLDAVNDVLGAAWDIPYAWGDTADKSRKTKLYQHVAMWNNQVARSQAGTGFSFETPACFLELRQGEVIAFAENGNMTEYEWLLHVVDVEYDAGDEVGMDQNLSVYTYRAKTKEAITGFQPTDCSTLFYTGERQDYDHAAMYHYLLHMKNCITETTDEKGIIYKEPPTNLELVSTFDDRPVPITPVFSYIWKVCKVMAEIVAVPDPLITQTLDNGAVIPLQYALNNDGTLTIPYLITTPGMAVLTPFLIDNGVIMDELFYPVSATFDNSANGGFFIGNNIAFNASLPMGA